MTPDYLREEPWPDVDEYHLPADRPVASLPDGEYEDPDDPQVDARARAQISGRGTQGPERNDSWEAGVDGLRYTDSGNAERLIARFGDHLRYVPAWVRWLTWDGRRWALDHDNVRVSELAKAIARNLFGMLPDCNLKQRLELVKWATRSEMTQGIAGTITAARSVPGIAIGHTDLDADPWVLNVANGTIDLRTGRLGPHRPDHLCTKVAPVRYEATAQAHAFHRFLVRVLPDPEIAAYVRRYAGYCLTGLVTEQVMPVWWGDGANGKSTLLTILEAVFGDYSVPASRDLMLTSKHEQHPTSLADLFRVRLAPIVELRSGAQLDEERLKMLTGGDKVKARRMREDFWSYAPTAKFVLLTNHRPLVEGDDGAIWRRLHLIPWTVVIPPNERDPHLSKTIIDNELPGVLNWCLAGLAEWQTRGLDPPAAVLAATDDYRRESDTVATFLADENMFLDPNARIPSSQLADSHNRWCQGNNIKPEAHWQRVVRRLKRDGCVPRKTGASGRFWEGIGQGSETPGDGG